MSKVLAAAAACAAAGVLTAAGSPAVPQSSASVIASDTHAGSKPVALTYKLAFPMQCGNPGSTPLMLTLPSAMTVPSSISPAAVLLNGRAADSVKTKGSKLVISMAQPGFIRCSVVGIGTLTVTIAKRAGLGNPKTAGVYGFPVAIGAMHGTPKLRIT